jgi:hypothetical protein
MSRQFMVGRYPVLPHGVKTVNGSFVFELLLD